MYKIYNIFAFIFIFFIDFYKKYEKKVIIWNFQKNDWKILKVNYIIIILSLSSVKKINYQKL